MADQFPIDPSWTALLSEAGLRPTDVFRRADLPEDLFLRPRPSIEATSYVRLWTTMAQMLRLETPGVAFAKAGLSAGPAKLAALCCATLTAAVSRVSDYKALVSPVRLDVHDTLGGLEVTFDTEGLDLPVELVVAEMVGLVEIARLGLGEPVKPIAVELKTPPSQAGYRDYFGRTLRSGPFDRVVFAAELAKRPFLSPEPALFQAFDPDLRPRLDELAPSSTITERVVALLMESLPSGHADVALIAGRLGLSARSLQRRLRTERTSFKDVLQVLRTKLARYYLETTSLSNAQIAFLLAYDDPNSFIRAFRHWTGTTPEAMRQDLMTG